MHLSKTLPSYRRLAHRCFHTLFMNLLFFTFDCIGSPTVCTDVAVRIAFERYLIPSTTRWALTCFIRSKIAVRGNKKAAPNGSGLYYKLIFYLPNNFAIAVPSSAGESTTVMPQSRRIAFLAAAVSSAPPTIAPA